MKYLGQYLAELGHLETTEFIEFITQTILSRRVQQLAHVQAAEASYREYPSYWRAGLQQYRETVLASISKPEFFLPVEFSRHAYGREPFGDVQEFVSRLGALFSSWPDIWRSARNLAAASVEAA